MGTVRNSQTRFPEVCSDDYPGDIDTQWTTSSLGDKSIGNLFGGWHPCKPRWSAVDPAREIAGKRSIREQVHSRERNVGDPAKSNAAAWAASSTVTTVTLASDAPTRDKASWRRLTVLT